MTNDSCPTPQWLMDVFRGWYDPCPLNPNPTFDRLKEDWPNRTYVNPPYSKPLPWVDKAIEEASKGKLIVMLLRADVSTEYYRKIIQAGGHVAFFNERLKFIGNGSPNFASMLVIFNEEAEA